MTGVNGTPMPSYGASIPPEDIWALVHYIQRMGGVR
jgi:mono/diheme cytochrome c family protein